MSRSVKLPGVMLSPRPVRAWSCDGAPHSGELSRGTSRKASRASGRAAADSASPGSKARGRLVGNCPGSSARKVASAGSRPSATTTVAISPWSNSSAAISAKQAKLMPTRTSRAASVSSSFRTSRPTASAAPGSRPKMLP